jgi:exosortase C (VPDSG-CTERM-specific)
LRPLVFPLGFLIFMVPMPTHLLTLVESVLQHGSATAALVMFEIAGTAVFRHELIFQLPGIALEVAPECSGIRSTLALFITSTAAAYLYLRTPWKRVALVAVVLPLALLRNGFRVFVIGELCVHISPDMIHSYIHRHGGPIFFLLSLIPFSIVLWLLVRSERKRSISV